MPIAKVEDDMYHKYDIVVSEVLVEIIKASSKEKIIRLLKFDKTNKDHLLVLRMALMARNLYNLPVEVDCGWWDRFVLNWKIRKNFKKIGKVPNRCLDGVWVPHVLDLIKTNVDFVFDFSNIYDAYYEGSLD